MSWERPHYSESRARAAHRDRSLQGWGEIISLPAAEMRLGLHLGPHLGDLDCQAEVSVLTAAGDGG